jgi:hypothetical protein
MRVQRTRSSAIRLWPMTELPTGRTIIGGAPPNTRIGGFAPPLRLVARR